MAEVLRDFPELEVEIDGRKVRKKYLSESRLELVFSHNFLVSKAHL